jgi:hypothetical protein
VEEDIIEAMKEVEEAEDITEVMNGVITQAIKGHTEAIKYHTETTTEEEAVAVA